MGTLKRQILFFIKTQKAQSIFYNFWQSVLVPYELWFGSIHFVIHLIYFFKEIFTIKDDTCKPRISIIIVKGFNNHSSDLNQNVWIRVRAIAFTKLIWKNNHRKTYFVSDVTVNTQFLILTNVPKPCIARATLYNCVNTQFQKLTNV